MARGEALDLPPATLATAYLQAASAGNTSRGLAIAMAEAIELTLSPSQRMARDLLLLSTADGEWYNRAAELAEEVLREAEKG